jgi:hypothetical protein
MKVFAPTSVWNAPLPGGAPLSPESSRLSTALSAEVRKEMSENTGPWINHDQFSVPVYTVGAQVPTVRVQLDTYSPALQAAFEAVPIPRGAREAAGGDGSLAIYQPATDTLWEFWLAENRLDGWHAGWGGRMTRFSESPGYFSDSYGASGTGLSLLGGLMTIKEMQAGTIDHALALAIPNTAADEIVWPAQRGDGHTTGPTAIPEGTHFRIDPSLDLARLNLPPLALAMARAAQKYGIIVRDTSACVTFFGEDPHTANGDPYGGIFGGQHPNQLLRAFPWDSLQVVAPRGA